MTKQDAAQEQERGKPFHRRRLHHRHELHPTAAARAEITSLRAAVAAQDGSLSQLQARVCGLEQQLQVCTRARTQNQYKNVTVALTAPSLPFSVQPGGLRCQSIPHFSGKKFSSHLLMLPISPL